MNFQLIMRGITMIAVCSASLLNFVRAQHRQLAADFKSETEWSIKNVNIDSTGKGHVAGKSICAGEIKSRPAIQNLKPKKKQSHTNSKGICLSEIQQNQNSTAVTAWPSPQAKKIILESDLFLKQDNIIQLRDNTGERIDLQPSCFSYDARQLTIDLSEVNKGNYVLLIFKKDGKIVCSTNIVKS